MKYVMRGKLSKKNLNLIEKKIGTDLKHFFYKQGFLKSLGSIINHKIKQKFFFVLINAPVKCSTKEVYSKIKKYSNKDMFNKKSVNKNNSNVVDICTKLEKCSIEEISKYLIKQGKKKSFPDITSRR